MSMNDRDRFDRWFRSQPFAQQALLRKQGVIPYDEMPIEDNVFPVIEDHKRWTVPIEDTRTESNAYMSEDEVRERMSKLFEVLEKFSDKNMKLHLRFIRSMLGSNNSEPLARLAKDFGITKQAMTWRARQVRSALGRIANVADVDAVAADDDKMNPITNETYKPRMVRDTYDDTFDDVVKISVKVARIETIPTRTPAKESPKRGGTSGVATHTGEKMGKKLRKPLLLAKRAKPRKR